MYVISRNGQLRVEGPRSTMTPELQRVLHGRRDELLAHLATWDQWKACDLLVAMQGWLTRLLGDRPVPEMDPATSQAYGQLAEAHDRRDWPGFLEALSAFEDAWRERIGVLRSPGSFAKKSSAKLPTQNRVRCR